MFLKYLSKFASLGLKGRRLNTSFCVITSVLVSYLGDFCFAAQFYCNPLCHLTHRGCGLTREVGDNVSESLLKKYFFMKNELIDEQALAYKLILPPASRATLRAVPWH